MKKILNFENFNISTNNPIGRVEVAKVLGHLLGLLGFGTSGVCLACFVEKEKKNQGLGENMGYT